MREASPTARFRWRSAALALGLLLAAPVTGLADWQIAVREVEVASGVTMPSASDPWRTMAFQAVPGSATVSWIRAEIELPHQADELRPLAVRLDALATCEIHWDGELIGAEGTVGADPTEEDPGPIAQVHAVPDRLAGGGTHQLLLRCSTHHRGFAPTVGFWVLQVGPFERLLAAGKIGHAMSLLSLGGMLLVGVYFLALFLLDRGDRSELLLACFSLVGAALLVVESLRRLVDYSYDLHLARLIVIALLAWLLNVLLVAFLVERFPALTSRRGRWWIAVTALLAAMPVLVFAAFDAKSTATFLVGLPSGLAWSLAAARRRQQAGSGLAAAGVGLCLLALLVDPFAFVDRTLYPALNGLLLLLLIAHARRVRAVRAEWQEARLQSSRLEAELLRRHLQPHFLMNSLTALSEWIEEDPRVAVRMIEALAAETRALGDLSTRSLVTVQEELDLCRSHLEVMALRQAVEPRLEVQGVHPTATIPPATFHTLVENALTHGDPHRREIVLVLAAESHGGRIRYTLRAPFTPRAGEVTAIREGGGLRYVRARLREAYGENWALRHGSADGAWVTEIEVPAEER